MDLLPSGKAQEVHSNFAAVATTDEWIEAAKEERALPKSDLGTSAVQGRAAFDS